MRAEIDKLASHVTKNLSALNFGRVFFEPMSYFCDPNNKIYIERRLKENSFVGWRYSLYSMVTAMNIKSTPLFGSIICEVNPEFAEKIDPILSDYFVTLEDYRLVYSKLAVPDSSFRRELVRR